MKFLVDEIKEDWADSDILGDSLPERLAWIAFHVFFPIIWSAFIVFMLGYFLFAES